MTSPTRGSRTNSFSRACAARTWPVPALAEMMRTRFFMQIDAANESQEAPDRGCLLMDCTEQETQGRADAEGTLWRRRDRRGPGRWKLCRSTRQDFSFPSCPLKGCTETHFEKGNNRGFRMAR